MATAKAATDEKDDGFKSISLIFKARQAEPLSATLIPELQRVTPLQKHWPDLVQKSSDVVKYKRYLMFICEPCLSFCIARQMTEICNETDGKLGPDVSLEFQLKRGTQTKIHENGYTSRTEFGKEPDEYAVLVKYRRAAFFET
jgi:hypothetical protein